jgi:hypothetical protein
MTIEEPLLLVDEILGLQASVQSSTGFEMVITAGQTKTSGNKTEIGWVKQKRRRKSFRCLFWTIC